MGYKATVELVLDCAEPQTLAKFWRDALDYREYYMGANLAVLVPKEGIASPLLLQGVPEPKAGKNRMHVDIVVDDIEAEVHPLRRQIVVAADLLTLMRSDSDSPVSGPRGTARTHGQRHPEAHLRPVAPVRRTSPRG